LIAADPLSAQTTDPSCFGPNNKAGVNCPGEGVDSMSATMATGAHAWALFAELNQAVFPGNTNDRRRVWETWKNGDDNRDASEAVFLANGHAPADWNVSPRMPGAALKRLVANQQLLLLRKKFEVLKRPTTLLATAEAEGQETRINRPGFNFILANELFNKQGQHKFASEHPNFDFPSATKEVKAAWVKLPAGADPSKYYTSTSDDGKVLVLVALHIITKDVPFWFWSSFVHKDHTKIGDGDVPLADYQEVPASLRGTSFENYRLIAELRQVDASTFAKTGQGAQLDWITRTGDATVLGNPQIEGGLASSSSCITCHSMASIAKDANGNVFHNSFDFVLGPTKSEFFKQQNVQFFPLDFLWSMQNARSFEP
jgi:hypothetical protein